MSQDLKRQALADLVHVHVRLCDWVIRQNESNRRLEKELAEIAVDMRQLIGRLGFFNR